MAGKFEVYKDNRGEFRFRLKAGNGQNILSSEGYSAKKSCMKKKTASGKYSFRLCATNGQCIGRSQSYASESGCDNGMKSVAKSLQDATLDDQT
jgi:uncharacterized protein YegP (UPF0339 family)